MNDPNPICVQTMAHIDAMPKKWRQLVNEYGFQAVFALYDNDVSLEDADDMLWMRRSMKQAEWLATNYIHAKPKRNYF